MRRRPAVVLVAVVALGSIANACGGASDGSGGGRPTQPLRPPTTGTPPPPPPPPPDAPDGSEAPDAPAPLPDLNAVAITLTEVATGLDSPVALATRPGDDAWYVAEQGGRLVRVRDGVVERDAVLDLSGEVSRGNEQGLLGVAFAPGGDLAYVDYTDRRGDTRVVEYPVDEQGALDRSAGREVLALEQPFANHNGGHLLFGPDGMLYVGLGDGGSGGDPQGHGQDTTTLLGSILRIDPRAHDGRPYSVPADNPFVDDPDARAEIWHHGLRNPWRFSFDRETGDVWIGDVGQRAREEVNLALAGDQSGVNWGWNLREGTLEFAGPPPEGAREPLFDYGRDEGISVTGGFVYRGEAVPELRGVYVYADFGAGELVGVVQRDGELHERRPLGVSAGSVTSFAEDPGGELHVLDRGGRLLRVDPA